MTIYEIYEKEKEKLKDLPPDKYEIAVKNLAEALGI